MNAAIRVREILNGIVSDALAIFETSLRERGATPEQFAEAMTAKRAKLDRWSAEAHANILQDLQREPATAADVRALQRTAEDLQAWLSALSLRVTVLERTVFGEESAERN